MSEDQQIADANSRLKSRARAKVPPRESSLLQRTNALHRSIETGAEDKALFSAPEFNSTNQQSNNATKQQNNNTLIEQDNLVSFTLRVDESISRGIKDICSDHRVTKETFLEAAYLICRQDAEVMERVMEIAKTRRDKRRKVGVRRRAESMAKYIE
ncbi:MAG TPA: hypothetical protein V6D19_08705 [Stenomitos sp.]